MAHDVFISYAAEDKTTADAVCARLEGGGVRCWIAPRDILPGASWKGSIVTAIGDARALVLIFSARSNASAEVAKEIAQAAKRGLSIVTFRIEDVPLRSELEYDLDAIHWLDALTPPLERHIALLEDKLHVVLERPRVERPTLPPTPAVPAPRGVSPALLAAVAGVAAMASGLLGWVAIRGGSTDAVPSPPAFEAQTTLETPPPAPAPEPKPVDGPPSVSPHRQASAAKRSPTPPAPAPRPIVEAPAASPRPVLPAEVATSSSDGADARVVGCWQDPRLPGILQIRADGTYVSGGTLTGKWTDIDRAGGIVMLQFADEIGQAQLSGDGRRLTLTGSVNDTLTRASGGSDLPGAWAFSNGLPVAIEADGTFRTATLGARWRAVDVGSRQYVVVWPGMRPSTALSADGESLTLTDSRYGFVQHLQRRPCAGR